MNAQTPKSTSSVVLFKNPLIERLTHVHPLTPILFWTPVISYLIYRGITVHNLGWLEGVSLFIMGLFAWTFVEYALHRLVFHFEASHPWSKKLVYLFHGIHHDSPEDATRLLMPPVAGILIAMTIYGCFHLVIPERWMELFFAFFLIGYLVYDYTHFFTHHGNPTSAWGKLIKKNHMTHHFVNQDSLWGVSSPLWDWVFNTLPGSKANWWGRIFRFHRG